MKRNRISENAKAVAEEVKRKVIKGEKIVMGKIIKKHGYSDGISKQPIRVRKTQSYQEEMKPIVEQLERERQRIISEMENKDLTQVQYGELGRMVDIFTKNIQLLSGGATERIEDKFNDEQIDTIAERISQRKRGDGKICSKE